MGSNVILCLDEQLSAGQKYVQAFGQWLRNLLFNCLGPCRERPSDFCRTNGQPWASGG